MEAYGLIGFSLTLIVTAQILDLGLGQTVTRELARRSTKSSSESYELVATVERVYWILAATSCALLLIAAPWVVHHILTSSQFSTEVLRTAVNLIAGLIALHFLINLYQCGLVGLEKFALVSAIRVVTATLASVGGVLVLIYVKNSVIALFTWNTCVAATCAICTRFLLQRNLPKSGSKARFRPDLLSGLWRFAAGMSGISVASVIVSQLDKWLLVNLLSLEKFGYYVLAGSVSGSLYLIVSPLFGVLFPRLSSLVAQRDEKTLIRLYSVGTQLVVTIVVPLAITLSLFSYEVLSIWTRNSIVSTQAAPILSVLVIGSALNGLMNIPFALHLAHGRTRLMLGINIFAIAFLLATILLLVPTYGPIGAAFAWLSFNIAFACLGVPITHRAFLATGGVRWFAKDVMLGTAIALATVAIARVMYPAESSTMTQAIWIIGSYLFSALLAALCGSQTREWLFGQVRKISTSD